MGVQIDPVAAIAALSRELRDWRATIRKRKAAPAADLVRDAVMLVGSMRIIEQGFRQKVAPLLLYDPSDADIPWKALCREIHAFAFADTVSPQVHAHVAALRKYQAGERPVPDGMPEDEPKTLARLGRDFLDAIEYSGPAGGRPTGWGPDGFADLQWLLDTVAAAREEDVEAVRDRARQAIEDRPRGALDDADDALATIRQGWVARYKSPAPDRPR